MFKPGDRVRVVRLPTDPRLVAFTEDYKIAMRSGIEMIVVADNPPIGMILLEPPVAIGFYTEEACLELSPTNSLTPAVETLRAEITKGRFITDKERALIEARIALRKALHGG